MGASFCFNRHGACIPLSCDSAFEPLLPNCIANATYLSLLLMLHIESYVKEGKTTVETDIQVRLLYDTTTSTFVDIIGKNDVMTAKYLFWI